MTNATATLDVVEFAAWHLAAEPSPERMEALLDVVREIIESPETVPAPARRARRVSPVPAPEAREPVPEDLLRAVLELPPAPAPEPEEAPAEPYDGPVKTCGRCSRELPATPEFFTRDRTRPDHLRYRCKNCERAVAKARPRRDRTKVATAKD